MAHRYKLTHACLHDHTHTPSKETDRGTNAYRKLSHICTHACESASLHAQTDETYRHMHAELYGTRTHTCTCLHSCVSKPITSTDEDKYTQRYTPTLISLSLSFTADKHKHKQRHTRMHARTCRHARAHTSDTCTRCCFDCCTACLHFVNTLDVDEFIHRLMNPSSRSPDFWSACTCFVHVFSVSSCVRMRTRTCVCVRMSMCVCARENER